ncbi:hypothetical protein [Methylomicrobium lacus]|uniref:hypothetical protein n=1 Tax=Methylomicrobium lacus TaxID=136992 RepID=UPI0035A8DCA1
MTVFSDLLDSFSGSFDDKTYPLEVYFHLLDRVRNSRSPIELGEALSSLLAWKDGKVRLSEAGTELINVSGKRYSVERPKPNTLGPRHEGILKSQEFFAWAKNVITISYFDPSLINVLTAGRFNLWSSVVIPAFLLHCLRPELFPIIDRWVFLSYLFVHNKQNKNLKPTIEDYHNYQKWWQKVVVEYYPTEANITPQQLKAVDSSLWALGKCIYSLGKMDEMPSEISDLEESLPIDKFSTPSAKATVGTESDVFKRRAVELSRSMTQLNAIKQAALELGIDLSSTPSYVKYPGSHFDRWRKQGFF